MQPIEKRFYLPGASQRISVCLPRKVFDRVMEASTYEGRSASNLCAYLIECSLDAIRPTAAAQPVLNRSR